MKNDNDIVSWNKMKIILKQKYPKLSDADLHWRDNTTREEMLEMISSRLGISTRQLLAEKS